MTKLTLLPTLIFLLFGYYCHAQNLDFNKHLKEPVQKKYSNGTIEYSGFRDGYSKKTGKWKYYYENGKLEATVEYSSNRFVGVGYVYYENGGYKQISDFNSKSIKIYYENGNLNLKGVYGDKDSNYGKGSRGKVKFYYESGQVYGFNTYLSNPDEGVLTGEWKFYHENGQLRKTGSYIESEQYINVSAQNGQWKYYYENGQLQKTGSYIEGIQNGQWKFYYDNGQMLKTGEYISGVKNDQWKFYDESGETMVRPLSYEFFNEFTTQQDYSDFVSNRDRVKLKNIDEGPETNIFARSWNIQSDCKSSYDKIKKTLKNENNCSSTAWMKDIPAHHNSYLPYEFDMNFSLTPSFKEIEYKWPLAISLGTSQAGKIWMGIDSSGKLTLSKVDKEGYHDLLEIFDTDRVHIDKPNHLKFVWFPNGFYYIELNSYKKWSFDLPDENSMLISPNGLSNKITFYTDIIIQSLALSTFEE